jgi:choline dehydrogenase-like flavoprotein
MNTRDNTAHTDVLVIGFGKGGKAVAAKMGSLGKHVMLVEQSKYQCSANPGFAHSVLMITRIC